MKIFTCIVEKIYTWQPEIEAESIEEAKEKLDGMFENGEFTWETAQESNYEAGDFVELNNYSED